MCFYFIEIRFYREQSMISTIYLFIFILILNLLINL